MVSVQLQSSHWVYTAGRTAEDTSTQAFAGHKGRRDGPKQER